MITKINNQNRTVSLINDGEINILKKAGLTDIEFTCLIPQVLYPFAVYLDDFKPASFFLESFEELKESLEPFQFIVTRLKPGGNLLFNSNITVSLEDYKIIENWEDNTFDLEVEITLKQYKHYGTKEIEIIEPPPPAGGEAAITTVDAPPIAIIHYDRPPENPPQARTHTVVRGDSLWEISRRFLNNGGRWREIYNLNPQIAQRNLGTGLPSSTIYPNQVLQLPDP
jgi:hypothetical protein